MECEEGRLGSCAGKPTYRHWCPTPWENCVLFTEASAMGQFEGLIGILGLKPIRRIANQSSEPSARLGDGRNLYFWPLIEACRLQCSLAVFDDGDHVWSLPLDHMILNHLLTTGPASKVTNSSLCREWQQRAQILGRLNLKESRCLRALFTHIPVATSASLS